MIPFEDAQARLIDLQKGGLYDEIGAKGSLFLCYCQFAGKNFETYDELVKFAQLMKDVCLVSRGMSIVNSDLLLWHLAGKDYHVSHDDHDGQIKRWKAPIGYHYTFGDIDTDRRIIDRIFDHYLKIEEIRS